MSVAVRNALTKLDQSIDKMEGALVKHQKSLNVPPQTDLFSAPPRRAEAAGTVVNFDRTALTRKLDMTIAKVEQLLGEG